MLKGGAFGSPWGEGEGRVWLIGVDGDPLRDFFDGIVVTGVEGVDAVEEASPRAVNHFKGGEAKEKFFFEDDPGCREYS